MEQVGEGTPGARVTDLGAAAGVSVSARDRAWVERLVARLDHGSAGRRGVGRAAGVSETDVISRLNDIGLAYLRRSRGRRRDNVERAVACFAGALARLPHERGRADYAWAVLQTNLGYAHLYRVEGDRRANLRAAVAHIERALQTFTPEAHADAWATAQHNRGLALLGLGGVEQEAPERALRAFGEALRIFGRTPTSYEWATLQNNIGAAYAARVLGDRAENLARAAEHHRAALRVFTREEYPGDHAMTLLYLADTLQERRTGDRRVQLEEAIAAYRAALDVFTADRYPRQHAMALNNLAAALVERVEGRSAENVAEALDCYERVARLCPREDDPVRWAAARNNLGLAYARLAREELARRDGGAEVSGDTGAAEGDEGEGEDVRWGRDAEAHFARAARCFEDALEVYEAGTYPRERRLMLWNLGNAHAAHGGWDEAHRAYARAHALEERLLIVGLGIEGRDAVRGENWDAHIRDAYALVRLGRAADAAVTLEAGRAREIARAWASDVIVPAGPNTPEACAAVERYRAALAAAREAQAALLRPAAGSTEQESGPTSAPMSVDLDRAGALRRALRVLAGARAEVEAAAGGISPSPVMAASALGADDLRGIASGVGDRHALVYVIAAPWGGAAIAVVGEAEAAGAGSSIEASAGEPAGPRTPDGVPLAVALPLPELTYDVVTDVIEMEAADGSGRALGGFAHAQEGHALVCLWQHWPAPTLGDQLARARAAAAAAGRPSPLVAAVEEALRVPELAGLSDRSLGEIEDEPLLLLANTANQAFLSAELERARRRLAGPLLEPLADWLPSLGAASCTLIPCGWLAALPLPSLPLDDGGTLGDLLPTSVAPAARALLTCQAVAETDRPAPRAGVYAAGNPHPTHQELPWGEAEAFAIAALAGHIGMPAAVAVQRDATRAWLAGALANGRVVAAACHASFDPAAPLDAAVRLARDARLTLADVLTGAVDLRGLRLLALSACQTAVAHLRGPTDEVRGIATGMLQAGARAVLASLWPVDDAATYLLMVRFFEEWLPEMDRRPPARALARARAWLRGVTNRDLRSWHARLPSHARPKEADAVGMAPDGMVRRAALRGPGDRYVVGRFDAQQAASEVRMRAWEGGEDARPYADALYWAAFQVYGW